MPGTLNITYVFADGAVLTAGQLNTNYNDIKNYINAGIDNIAAGAITNSMVNASAGITVGKLAGGTAGQVLVTNSTTPTWTSLGGDIASVTSAGVVTIANLAISTGKIADDAVTPAKISQGTAGQILMSNATPDTAWVTMSGDATMSGAGALTIANGAITTAKLGDAQVTLGKMATNSVDSDQYVDNSIDPEHLATGAIFLGIAEKTANTNHNTGTPLDVSVPLAITVPAGGRRVKLTVNARNITASVVSGTTVGLRLYDGTVAGGTMLKEWNWQATSGGLTTALHVEYIHQPSAGAKTYNLGVLTGGAGQVTVEASSGAPLQFWAEYI